jgi:hypothetical protein
MTDSDAIEAELHEIQPIPASCVPIQRSESRIDLNTEADAALRIHWTREDCYREFGQNAIDGAKERLIAWASTEAKCSLSETELLKTITCQRYFHKKLRTEVFTLISQTASWRWKLADIYYNPHDAYFQPHGRMVFINYGTKLSARIFLNGHTSKQNKAHMIGQFGDGMKTAIKRLYALNTLACEEYGELHRQKDGKNVFPLRIYTNGQHWTPCEYTCHSVHETDTIFIQPLNSDAQKYKDLIQHQPLFDD